MVVGHDKLPIDVIDEIAVNDAELLFAGEVVADVAVVQRGWCAGCLCAGLDQECDGDGGATTGAKDLATLFARLLTSCSLIAAKVVDI